MGKSSGGTSARKMTCALLVCAAAVVLAGPAAAKGDKGGKDLKMSAMGQFAAKVQATVAAGGSIADLTAHGVCINEPDCEDDSVTVIPGGQAETSIAIDSTGQHIVIGYNDTRGFSLNPVSVSGVMVSHDGGTTFIDGGQLPSPGLDVIGTTRLPQVFGDPEVKYLGGCNFIYSSILVKKFSATPARTAQTLGVHRSTDCGNTWTGPFEVTAATNPNGLLTPGGTPRDAADKEFMDVDPDTGRVIMSWSNFTPVSLGGVEIATTYSDDILTGNPPTWTPRAIIAATDADGQSSVPRFAGNGSTNAYVAWRRFPFPGTFFGYGNTIGFARSTDNGATWSAPVELSPEFFTMDQVLGNDRVNTSPSLAVDTSKDKKTKNNVYIVYANNNNADGADIVFQKSEDGGLTFSTPLVLNSRPGNDGPQWFPWVTIDKKSGRVYVMYYDQGVAQSGDLTEISYTYSDDGGKKWKQPRPLTARPFHAGWGNDTGQPNLGDYIQAVAQDDEFFAAYALASRPPLGFADGQPASGNMTVPDVEFVRMPASKHKFKATTLDLRSVQVEDSGGNGYIDPNETVTLNVDLRNYVTNSLNAEKVSGAKVKLSTPTPGVQVVKDDSPLPKVEPGETVSFKKELQIKTLPTFVPGTPIELVFSIKSAEHGDAVLRHTLFTGTTVPTTLFSENFDAAATLPAGWTAAHGGGDNTVPWTVSSSFCGATPLNRVAFHQNANDGLATASGPARFERLFSPLVTIPADAQYVTVEMDICYNTEDDPNFNVTAYDGFLLRITDQTPGRFVRSELVEAFADEFTTGDLNHYPKHFPRGSIGGRYFEDMSAWAGDSGGWKHVTMRLPGMQGSTVQLRFEYTQDSFGTCADLRSGPCGVAVDNIVVKSHALAP